MNGKTGRARGQYDTSSPGRKRRPRYAEGNFETKRLKRLLRATDHIAPYLDGCGLYGSAAYWAARRVVKSFLKGDLLTLDRDVLRVAAGRAHVTR